MSVANPVIDYIDGVNRLIYLRSGVRQYHPVDDLYKEERHLRQNDESLRQYDKFIGAAGNVEKSPGENTERYAIFLQGTRVVPASDTSHTLTITGQQIDGLGLKGSSLINKAPLPVGVLVDVDYLPPPAAEVVSLEAIDTQLGLANDRITDLNALVIQLQGVQALMQTQQDWLKDWHEADEVPLQNVYERQHKTTKAPIISKNVQRDGSGNVIGLIEP